MARTRIGGRHIFKRAGHSLVHVPVYDRPDEMTNSKCVVVGGGLAGSAFAIQVARHGRQVTILERTAGPHHKVCGEFLSSEANSCSTSGSAGRRRPAISAWSLESSRPRSNY